MALALLPANAPAAARDEMARDIAELDQLIDNGASPAGSTRRR